MCGYAPLFSRCFPGTAEDGSGRSFTTGLLRRASAAPEPVQSRLVASLLRGSSLVRESSRIKCVWHWTRALRWGMGWGARWICWGVPWGRF